MSVENPLANFESQAHACDKLGSAFTAELCRLIPQVMGATAFATRLRNWPGDAGADALALRACGALHAMARSGSAPNLQAVYPPNQPDPSMLRATLAAEIGRNDAFLTAYLDSPPQTNEVARSSLILGAALHAAKVTGLPLEVLEIGASAGLNLQFAHYAYAFGPDLTWGQGGAPLTIRSEWSGNPPPFDAALEVIAQRGCDQNPLDPRDPKDRQRLISYVWPDQTERLDRIERALAFAATQNIVVEKMDAADWVERELSASPQPGRARMIYHTIVWQYLPAAIKSRISAAIERAAIAAKTQTPLIWFRFENDMAGEGGLMQMTLWPGGETRTLGRADFHGRWVNWL